MNSQMCLLISTMQHPTGSHIMKKEDLMKLEEKIWHAFLYEKLFFILWLGFAIYNLKDMSIRIKCFLGSKRYIV